MDYLTGRQVDQVIENAFRFLLKQGILITHQGMRERLGRAKANVSGDRVTFPTELVSDALKQAPREIQLYDSLGRQSVHLADRAVHFAPGSAAPWLYDHTVQKNRRPLAADVVRLGKLVSALQNVELNSTALIPYDSDIPQGLRDAYRMYLALLTCPAPLVTGIFGPRHSFLVMKSMIEAVRGGEEDRCRPYAIFDNCPVHGGRWEDPFIQNLIDCAEAGYPVEFVSMPQPGLTCRADLMEAVSLHAAETLAGVVMVHVVTPGAPAIWGGSPMGVHLDYLTPSLAHTATFKMASATAQIGNYLRLPTHVYLGGGGNWQLLDHQTGGESALGLLTAALAGINVVSGVGMNRHEAGFDLLKLIADDYFCGVARALAQPIQGEGALRGDTTSFTERMTQLLELRDSSDFFDPQGSVDSRGLGQWEKAGCPSLADRLTDSYARLIGSWEPPGLRDGIQESLYDTMAAAFEACGGSRDHVLTPEEIKDVAP